MNQDTIHDSSFALYLADRSLAPLFSSANSETQGPPDQRSSTQSLALSSLTSTAVTAYDASLRFNLGVPLRIMVETHNSGPNLFVSYLNPPSINELEGLENDKRVNEINRNGASPLDLPANIQTSSNHLTGAGTSSVNDNHEHSTHLNGAIDNNETGTLPPPPLLVAMAVASSPADAPAARKAITQLARAGRECQRAWTRDHEEGPAQQLTPVETITKNNGPKVF
ncbi:hypothetical protein K3495_g2273 [Podosphaera aphanis]|nr:hypothetical protein K3495_g2273 [Podosphaera aphanis]